MKSSVLASGSKGNSTYIETSKVKILVDLGTSSLYVERELKSLGIEAKDIQAIFLTHTHVDHVGGLRVFIKKYNPTIYLSKLMYEELVKIIELPNYQLIDEAVSLADLDIKVIKTSHDTNDSNAYVFLCDNHSLAYITDTGYLNSKNHKYLKNIDTYIIESNHDVDMLMEGSYPFHIKQRILGDRGHLSNKQCTYYLEKFIGDKTKNIILIHLSHDNNTSELALSTLKNMLTTHNYKIDKVIVSNQKEKTIMVEV